MKCTHERVPRGDVGDCEDSDRAFVDVFRQHVTLDGDLDEAQRERIAYIVGRCPVHRTLEQKPRFEDRVELVVHKT